MSTQSLYQQISHYDQWKRTLSRQLERLQNWSHEHGSASHEIKHSIARARHLLAHEHFTLAFVGEFSRGKTELINALLFKEFGQRLLPSTPGRTTMCPTEIYCETDPQKQNNCVRLLPIETRSSSASMHSFKRIPQKWVTLNFDPRDPDSVKQAIGQVSATKYVNIETARKLGFDANHYNMIDNQVEIPAWRHALITLDHPLLRHGLRIIDTPGLNALGNEPELTLRTLPSAQAVVFLLAADSGVSASDMQIWEEHIDILRKRQNLQVLTLLNKIDSLWDDLLPDTEIASNILRIRKQTASLLCMPIEDVIALSAKQGLLGKATRNRARLERSNFLPFEQTIASSIVQNRLRIANQPLLADIIGLFENTRESLKQQLFDRDAELEKLEASHSLAAQQAVLTELRGSIRQVHSRYHKQSLSLRTSQRLLQRQLPALIAPVSMPLLNSQIQTAKTHLSSSWTSLGLSNAIANFYKLLGHNFDNLERETQQANRLLASIYNRKEHKQNSDELMQRHLLNFGDFRARLEQLSFRANRFQHSLDILLASKSTVINRFLNTLVRETQEIYRDLNHFIENWQNEALAPLLQHSQYQKQLLEHHMLRLAKLNHQNEDFDLQLLELRSHISQSEHALQSLDNILKDTSNTSIAEPHPHGNRVVSLSAIRKATQG